jgi:hypothetical protein
MQQTTHTPGPWRHTDAQSHSPADIQYEPAVIWQCITPVAVAHYGGAYPTETQANANARLIAAAPDLLEALQALIATRVPGAGSKSPEWIAACAAIAKATGNTP